MLAAFDLLNTNDRIIGIAIKYGYESQDAFSRAFRNYHGVLPFIEDNKAFAAAFQQSYTGLFDTYSHLKNEVVVEVKPTKITLWEYENGKPCRVFFDVSKQTCTKEFYVGE